MTDWLRELGADDGKTTATPEAFLSSPEREMRTCCFWYYKLNPEVAEFTQMGLMTDDPVEAQRQLVKIYGSPVIDLHRQKKNV